MSPKQLQEIIEGDFKAMKLGAVKPDNAFKLHCIMRAMYAHDETGKVKKTISKFYEQLKKHYPETAEYLRTR